MTRHGLATLPLALLMLGVATCSGAHAGDAPTPPYESIRTLRRLQEQLAHGNAGARTGQGALLATLATRFVEADPQVWRDPRNARAAVLFLFSGGRPAVVRTILSRSTMPRDIDRLVKGALAYAEGQDQIARDLLDPIDPRSLAPALGGQLALVKATLFAPADPAKAAKLLDVARLLVPGSLVEEAALRRQIALDTDPASLGKFIALARQYLRRYGGSIYAQNFKQQFAEAAIRLAREGDLAQMARLDPVMAELPVAEQRALYLAMAKTAIVQGRTPAARMAASRAVTIAADTTRDAVRAKLYLDAAAIVSDDVVKGIAALEAADRSQLSADDAELRDAALAVAHSVQAPVGEATDAATATAGVPGGPDAALLDQARQAIASGDLLLGKAQ